MQLPKPLPLAALAVLVLASGIAHADTTFSFQGPVDPGPPPFVCDPITDAKCILGEASSFAIYGVQLTKPSVPTNLWTLKIETNYPPCNPITPGCTLLRTIATPGNLIPPAPYGAFGPLFSISDFIIQWNGNNYGIVLAPHVNDGSSVGDGYTAGNLYQAPTTISGTSLMSHLGMAARNFPVWLGPGGVQLGSGNVSVVSGGNGTPAAYTITVQFFAPAGFLDTGTFNIIASSYPCANGLILGSASFEMLTVAKSFGAAAIQQGGITSMTLTIGNPDPLFAATNVTFTDTLPAGLQLASSTPLANTCGGSFAPALAVGATVVSFSGGAIPASGTCSISLSVTGMTMTPATSPLPPCPAGTTATGNQKINCITVTALVNGQTLNGGPAMAILSVSNLAVAKSFSPAMIQQGGASSMTLTIANPNATVATNVSFTDTLPAGVQVANTTPLADSCGGTFNPALAVGAGSVAYSAGSIAGMGSCSITLSVTGATTTPAASPACPAGTIPTGNQKINCVNVSATVNAQTITAGPAVATLVVRPKDLNVTKAFSAPSILIGETASFTVTLTNPNTSAATNVAISDILPSGLQLASAVALADTCGGSFSPALSVGATGLSYSGGSIPALSSCSISLSITGITASPAASPIPPCPVGTIATGNQKINCVGVTAIVNGATVGGTAMATIVVNTLVIPMPPTLAKAFSDASVMVGDITTLTFQITNPNVGPPPVTLFAITFSDTLPVGLIIATPNGLTGSCGGGTITAFAATNAVGLTGATLPGGGSCTFSIKVQAVLAGVQDNVTTKVIGTTGPLTLVGNSAEAMLCVSPPADAFQVNYIPNDRVGGYVDITNAGVLGADKYGPRGGTTGRICANVYVFSPDEQEISCCSCLVTPNALVHLSAADLISNTANGVIPPDSVVVKILFTVPGASPVSAGTQAGPAFTASACNAALPFDLTNLAPGGRAWAIKLHSPTVPPVTFYQTETRFLQNPIQLCTVTANASSEIRMLTNLCQFITGNQSGAGVCRGCSLGGFGAGKK